MLEAIETQPWAAIAAAAFLMIVTRAFWSLMRTGSKRNRKDRLEIRPLTPSETASFTEAWASLQRRFVDNPQWTVSEAEQLARDVMQKRGYPMRDFQRRAAAIALEHPDVVANYRAAQAIASRDRDGADLRQAVVHYRALFDELLDVITPPATADKLAGEHA